MVDATPRSAIAEQLVPGHFGVDGNPGVSISEVRERTLVHLSGNPAIAEGVKSATGLDLPLQAGGVSITGDQRLCWLGPDQWLLKTAPAPFGEWERKLASAAPAGAYNDVTHGRTTLRLTGPNARDVLAKGCPLDLHTQAFSPGQCAQSLLGHLSVLLDGIDEDTIDVTLTRSYGGDLFEWVSEAALEYGYVISA
ncbi:MAG: sarcosine oxidase subunit gamma [Rhodospirillaceae bacterium]|jgi:sarcosine oxidase, subunit gamma|nr:sarcosine oxidase subunit gamma [Rhodospirillaceae bacterium]